ncbi:MAG: helix-turn-helix domain-containing protein [Catenulispora sp.]|nr:helix-turn-helix domain-containing protein [Catenulispora sp.]
MDANLLSSAADPIAAQVGRFAAGHGVAATSLAESWDTLALGGMRHPGLAFADWTETSALGGLLAPVLVNCPTVAAMIDDLERFHPLIDNDRIIVERGTRHASVTLHAPDGRPSHPDTVDACFALLCRAIRRLAGDQATPTLVTLRRPAPPDPGGYAVMAARVAFDQPGNQCRFDETALLQPIAQADPVVRSMLRPYAERRLAHLGSSWTAAVGELLADRPLGLAEAAGKLAVSTRTLQSRLEAEGTTFAALADTVRRDQALALLAQPDLPVTTVASRTGFATPSAFTRAFRRWTGQSPSEYRRNPPR